MLAEEWATDGSLYVVSYCRSARRVSSVNARESAPARRVLPSVHFRKSVDGGQPGEKHIGIPSDVLAPIG